VAIEYDLRSDAEVDDGALLAFFAASVGADAVLEGVAYRSGMSVTAIAADDEEVDSTGRAFGFKQRSTVVFRFSDMLDEDIRDRNAAMMVGAALTFFGNPGRRGVLLFNGEMALIQSLDDGLVVSDEWEEWLDGEETAGLLAGRPVQSLHQPYL
jgi:hypothetical protein